MELNDAILTLAKAGATIVVPDQGKKHLSISQVAERYSCSDKWVRRHMHLFPGRWQMPGGDWRIPERDVEKLPQQRKAKVIA